ncbi:MAG: FecR domain-containing protein [Flavobacteriaceae bacterium]|nr:FecR family protein [Bacteroidia bacterium]NNK82253.1 FecR domain-containing protein [Flavobacteriaceae bacterium]
MDKYKHDDTFLARWISGDLTPEEFESFKKNKDFNIYTKINKVSQEFTLPALNKELLFSKVHNRQNSNKKRKTKVVKLVPNWAYAAAASIIITLGVFYFNSLESNFQTGFSEQMAVVLPDNSKIQLNANSDLNFRNRNWKDNRELNLSGEAFFEVEKGNSFKVITNQGVVEVLGTEFNVLSRDNYFEVRCKEGKVRVTSNSIKTKVILLKGNALRIVNGDLEKWNFNINETNWILGESSFYNTPLSQVLIALKNQFKVDFDTSNIDLDSRFTGGFSHKDMKLALKTVLQPMDILYTYNSKTNKIILVNSK